MRMKIIGASLLALGLAACGKQDNYADATPDVQGLTLETNGGTTEVPPTALIASGGSESTAATTPQAPEFLVRTRDALKSLNQFVVAAVHPVEELAQLSPSSPNGDTRVFGPADLTAAGENTPTGTFKLTVRKAVMPDTFWFKLQGKPIGADDSAYVVVLGGRIHRGDRPHRGHGMVGIDLDKLHTVNTQVFLGAGKLLAGFGHVGDAKSLVYILKDFTPNATDATIQPLTAAFVGHKTDTVARVRVAAIGDFWDGPNGRVDLSRTSPDGVNELLLSRIRWVPGLGGRAAVVVKNYTNWMGSSIGDVPAGQFFLGLSCWDASEGETFKGGFLCTVGQPLSSCTPVTLSDGTGALANCVPGTELDTTSTPTAPTNEGDTTPEPDAPTTPDAPPTSMMDLMF